MVLNIDQVKQDAYELGLDYHPVQDPEGFQGMATYANEVLPKLREMAGYEDAGHGTFQVVAEVEFTADDYNGVLTARSSEIMTDAVGMFWEAASTPEGQ